jgi:hypothetical protein
MLGNLEKEQIAGMPDLRLTIVLEAENGGATPIGGAAGL